jgi:hypothetical protein
MSDATNPHRPQDDSNQRTSTYHAALVRESGVVPADRVDWDAFHRRLAARAELSLARLRYPHLAADSDARPDTITVLTLPSPKTHPWWEYAARWSRLTVTASVAAGIALMVIVRNSPKESIESVATNSVAISDPILEGRRAAFDSTATGRNVSWTKESTLPTAADLLIPLGKGSPVP